MLPYLRDDLEYESPIGQYRVSQGLTIKELCKKACVHISHYSGLQNGMISPIYERGKNIGRLKSSARSICDTLNIKVEDAFPRYFCNIQKTIESFTNEQIVDLLHGDIRHYYNACFRRLLILWLYNVLISAGLNRCNIKKTDRCNIKNTDLINEYRKRAIRDYKIFVLAHIFGYTSTEIARKFCLSIHRICQICDRQMRALSHESRKLQLLKRLPAILQVENRWLNIK